MADVKATENPNVTLEAVDIGQVNTRNQFRLSISQKVSPEGEGQIPLAYPILVSFDHFLSFMRRSIVSIS